jgi:hypothetical protein
MGKISKKTSRVFYITERSEKPRRGRLPNEHPIGLFRREGQKRENARPLDRFGHDPLVLGTGSGDTARKDFTPLGYKTAEGIRVFVIDLEFLGAKTADFLLEENFAPPAPPLFIVTVATVFAVTLPVFMKWTAAPSIKVPWLFTSPGLRICCFPGVCFDFCRYYFLLIRHVFLLD